jgi:type II secretion system protein D
MKIDGDKVSLQFPNNSITDILGIYELLTERTLVKDTGIFEGQQISLVTPKPVEKGEAIKLIEASLLTNGYAIVTEASGKSARILPTKSANAQQATASAMFSQGVQFFQAEKDIPDNESIISYFLQLKHMDPTQAGTTLGNHVGLNVYGRITPVTTPPGLLITENATIVKQLIHISQIIDQPDTASSLVTKFIPMKYADAATVAQIIQATLDAQAQDKKDKGIVTIRGQAGAAIAGKTPAPAPAAPAAPGQPGTHLVQAKAQVTADPRLNQVLVVAEPEDFAYVSSLIAEFDKPVDVPVPYERPLKNVFSLDLLSVLADLLKETTKGGTQLPGGGTLSVANAQSQISTSNSFITGRNSANNQRGGTILRGSTGADGTTSAVGSSRPDQLQEATQDNAPQGVIVNKTRIIADPLANSIIVIGPKEDQDKIDNLLDKLDRKSPQVYLSTVIGELTLGKGFNLGIDYLQHFTSTGKNSGVTSSFINQQPQIVTGNSIADVRDSLITSAFGPLKGFNIYGQIGTAVDTFVNALETTNDFKVISRPSVFALNNKKAVITSGQKIPYAQSQTTNTNSATTANNGNITVATEFLEVVLKLEVIPLINPDGEVTLRIAQVNDTVVGSQVVGNNTVPIVGTEQLVTTATVSNGNTIVLGGLITESDKKNTSGIPGLSRIPIIGNLFKSHDNTKERKELLIFIQPQVVTDNVQQRNASLSEDLRTRVGADAYKAFPDKAWPKAEQVDSPPTRDSQKKSPTGSKSSKEDGHWYDSFHAPENKSTFHK